MIGFGMVAEKRTVWRSSGASFKIVSISSRNPMFSISSASSSTIVWRLSKRKVRRRRWSITRPGVPITSCTPPFKERICFPISCPPYTGRILMPCINLLSLRISSATWIASSLVGHRMIACSFRFFGSIFWRSGIPKAAVFPVPVCAWPITSCPAITSGIAFAWIGLGSSNPISVIARRIFGSSPSVSNFMISIY